MASGFDVGTFQSDNTMMDDDLLRNDDEALQHALGLSLAASLANRKADTTATSTTRAAAVAVAAASGDQKSLMAAGAESGNDSASGGGGGGCGGGGGADRGDGVGGGGGGSGGGPGERHASLSLAMRRLLCDELLRLNGARLLSRRDVANIWSWAEE
jgi:hypothetical protein